MTSLHDRAAALLAAEGPYYAERDSIRLEPHFFRHMMAMTSEKLHSKAAIADELAYRDALIRELLAENEKLQVIIDANTSTIAVDDSLYRGNSVRYWHDKLTARTAENERLRARVAELDESLHMANGTADLAMKHRDMAEKRVAELESGMHNIVSHWVEVGGPMATRGAIFAIARRSLGDAMPDTAAVDVGPTPFQGRKTRRNEE